LPDQGCSRRCQPQRYFFDGEKGIRRIERRRARIEQVRIQRVAGFFGFLSGFVERVSEIGGVRDR